MHTNEYSQRYEISSPTSQHDTDLQTCLDWAGNSRIKNNVEKFAVRIHKTRHIPSPVLSQFKAVQFNASHALGHARIQDRATLQFL